MMSPKKLVSIGLFVLPFLGLAQSEQFIEWSPKKRLTWADYLAAPASSSDAAAITNTALGMEYHIRNNSLSYSISCRFSKTKSWGKHKTEYILQHEQGHFDITEIFARRLARELKEYKFNPARYQDDLNAIYKRLMDQKEAYQNLYDQETDFSRNRDKQDEWLKKIDEELQETDEFANYQSTVNV